MRKIILLSIFLTVLLASNSSAEILRCKGKIVWSSAGTDKWMGQPLSVQLDIVIPDKNDPVYMIGLFTEGGKLKQYLSDAPSEYRKGVIEIVEFIGQGITKASRNQGRYELIVSKMPDVKGGNSLVGFFAPYAGMYIFTLRVDVWEKNKPFYFYRSELNELISGNCE